MHKLAKFIYFKLLGWKVTGNTTFSKESIKKAVIIGVPHTSWYDFIIGILLRKVVNIRVNFIGKKELFTWPFGYYFRAVGGRPVDRFNKENKVAMIAKLFTKEDEFRLALAPEGTRKKVQKWRTGFYYIAKAAGVPIIMFTLDFTNKKNHISEPFYPTDDVEKDFEFMYAFYKGVEGKVKAFSF